MVKDAEVDSHFHVWELQKFPYQFPDDIGEIIKKDISFDQLRVALGSSNVKNAVFVQCVNGCVDEAVWVLESKCAQIKGVVAGVDLTNADLLNKQLDTLCKYEKFVGVRHLLDFEDVNWLGRDDVIKGLEVLRDRGLTFDACMRPIHTAHAAAVAERVPGLRMVINHISKPELSQNLGSFAEWAGNMAAAASHPNVFCKISGLVTEVDPETQSKGWTKDTFSLHVNFVLKVFGPGRCMIGSDWPVCLLANGTNYKEVHDLHMSLISHLPQNDQIAIKGGNAARFYKLKNLD